MRAFAFAASRSSSLSALGRLPAGETAATDQKTATADYQAACREELLDAHPGLKIHLAECGAPGAASWLGACLWPFRGAPFAAAMRYRLRAPPAGAPDRLPCPGCAAVFDNDTFDLHTAGCVKFAGRYATTKHNEIVKYFSDLCDQACVASDPEPRDMQVFKCLGCGAGVAATARATHHKACGASFARSGPDLRVHWSGGSVVYDVTVAHVTAPSYAGRTPASIIAGKISAKHDLYDPILGGEPLVVLPLRALGGIEPDTKLLVRTLAGLAGESPEHLCAGLSVALARGVGLALAGARRPNLRL